MDSLNVEIVVRSTWFTPLLRQLANSKRETTWALYQRHGTGKRSLQVDCRNPLLIHNIQNMKTTLTPTKRASQNSNSNHPHFAVSSSTNGAHGGDTPIFQKQQHTIKASPNIGVTHLLSAFRIVISWVRIESSKQFSHRRHARVIVARHFHWPNPA